MKRIILVLCMVVLLASCSANKAPVEVEKADKTDKAVTETVEESEKESAKKEDEEKENVAKLSVEDIFWDLSGFHVSTDYVDDFAKTRSAVLSCDKYAAVRIYELDGEYFIMQVSTFEGGAQGKFESMKYDGNGKYELIFSETGDYGVGCTVYYTPGEKIVRVRFDKDMSMWELNKEVYDFYRYPSDSDMEEELGRLLFAKKNSTFGYPVSVKIKDNYYDVYVAPYTFTTSPFGLDEGDGGFVNLICNSGEGGRIFAKYRYENGKITLTDEYGEMLGVFE